MATPLLLALALIQAPSAAPPDQQLASVPTEPILATGIKVQVVEAPAAEAESYGAPMAPVSTASYVGVVPKMNPCRWAAAGYRGGFDVCSSVYRWSPDGVFMTGSPYQEWVAWQVRAEEDRLAASRAASGRAIQEANAAKTAKPTPAASKSSTGTGGGRDYFGASPAATGGASGGGRATGGTVTRGTGGGSSKPGGKSTGELP